MKTHAIALSAVLIPAAASAQPDSGAPGSQATTHSAPSRQVAADLARAPAPSQATDPPPEYQEVTDSYNAQMLMTGAFVFGASYGASLVVAGTSDGGRGNDRLYVPIAGPWLALHDRGPCDITKSSCNHETTAKVLLITDGVFQAVGILGMIDAVLQPPTHRVLVRTAKLDTKVHMAPTMVHGNPGLGVFGRF